MPTLGEWEGPIFGELGALRSDGSKVECHACGRYFAALGRHVRLAHDLHPDEYRAIFGLNQGQGLVGPAYRAVLSKAAAKQLSRYWPTVATRLTEARGSWQGRRMRLQARRNPEDLERWREAARRGGARISELRASGQWQPTALHEPGAAARASAQAHARLRELRTDPAWMARWRERLRQANGGGPVDMVCKICERPMEANRRNFRRGFGRLCSPGCRAESRRQANVQRWRGDPAHAQVAERLRVLPIEKFTALGERDRQLVRLYYGLEDGATLLQSELAEQFGLSAARVGEVIRTAVAQLLGPSAVPASVDRQISGPDRVAG